MYRITFRYQDAMSNWEWLEQSCTMSFIKECIEWYGLGVDCEYEIISVEKIR